MFAPCVLYAPGFGAFCTTRYGQGAVFFFDEVATVLQQYEIVLESKYTLTIFYGFFLCQRHGLQSTKEPLTFLP